MTDTPANAPAEPMREVEQLQHKLALIGLEYAAKGMEAEAATINATIEALSAPHRGLVESLWAIADGEGDAQVIAAQTLAAEGLPVPPAPLATPAGEGGKVERWTLQFSNTPPSVAIWAALPGREPRNTEVVYCRFDDAEQKERLAPIFYAIERAHNSAIEAAALSLSDDGGRK
jgi:hypothetical protein